MLLNKHVLRKESVAKCRASQHACSIDRHQERFLASVVIFSPALAAGTAECEESEGIGFHLRLDESHHDPYRRRNIVGAALSDGSGEALLHDHPSSLLPTVRHQAPWRVTLLPHLLYVGEVHQCAVTTEADVTPTGSLARQEVHQSKGIVVRGHLSGFQSGL